MFKKKNDDLFRTMKTNLYNNYQVIRFGSMLGSTQNKVRIFQKEQSKAYFTK